MNQVSEKKSFIDKYAKILVVVAVLLGATSGNFGVLISAPPTVIGFWRLTISLPFFVIPVLCNQEKRTQLAQISRKNLLFSFVAGFLFGELMDVHELWITKLPLTIPLRILYFVLSYLILCFGIALSNRCKLPIIPTDLFPRDLAEILQKPYSRVKITFDVTCLLVTGCLTYFALGKIMGLGIGTVIAAFTMGKGVAIVGNLIDKKFIFVSVLSKKEEA